VTTAALNGLKEVPMEIEVHGNHVQVPEELRLSALKKTERLSRYLAGMERAQVNFSDTPVGHLGDPITCEVVLEGHGHVVRAVGVGGRPTVALDAAVEKASMQLARLKRKLVGRSRPRHGRGKAGALTSGDLAGQLHGEDLDADDDFELTSPHLDHNVEGIAEL
jgi:ribosomal subunit interface protein